MEFPETLLTLRFPGKFFKILLVAREMSIPLCSKVSFVSFLIRTLTTSDIKFTTGLVQACKHNMYIVFTSPIQTLASSRLRVFGYLALSLLSLRPMWLQTIEEMICRGVSSRASVSYGY